MNENERGSTAAPLAQSPFGSSAIRVLHVEDDPICREWIAGQLAERGFVVRSFTDATCLADGLVFSEADIILLNWNIPGLSGIELLMELRQSGVTLPVVFLTSHVEKANEKLAFERGAVDFIDKARGVEILVSRLRLVSKTGHPAPVAQTDGLMVGGRLVLRRANNRAYWDGVDVGLTVGQYKITYLLASNAGRHVTFRAIYDRLRYVGFQGGIGDDGYRTNVRSAVKKVRNKFREYDPTFVEIENYRGFGYRWADTSVATWSPPSEKQP
jgi:two-component system response regulator ChvI